MYFDEAASLLRIQPAFSAQIENTVITGKPIAGFFKVDHVQIKEILRIYGVNRGQ